MMTFEEYDHEHNPRNLSRIEIVINLVLFVSFGGYFVYKAIVGLFCILN